MHYNFLFQFEPLLFIYLKNNKNASQLLHIKKCIIISLPNSIKMLSRIIVTLLGYELLQSKTWIFYYLPIMMKPNLATSKHNLVVYGYRLQEGKRWTT